ncbi:aldo/keto reductase [Oceanicoccus sp. KOV_DT_Chl]|uniref:aldo/keto reductase n=1 Tax=Oceanicoccus sp. KOV_DT_Chl TaxID=1904639 RepID=UPI000C7A6BC2|nr:aldo/keto reductase [Oceanicoccus sp. KOV_DT_Chl]
MKLRKLGSTEIFVSPLGLGTVKLGRDQGVKYPENFVIPDDKAAGDLIALAKELGLNLIDTAPAYGNSEQRLGTLLKGQRQDWVICSKVGEEYENGKSFYNFNAEHTRHSIERSLKRLNTDYIDMVLVHSDGNDLAVINEAEVLQELAACKQRGLIRAYGVSTKTVAGGIAAADKTDIVMATYNLDYREEAPVIEHCQQINKGLLIKKAFASGHLCAAGEDPIQKSMDFIFSHDAISSVIIGTINPAHLRANVQAAMTATKTKK